MTKKGLKLKVSLIMKELYDENLKLRDNVRESIDSGNSHKVPFDIENFGIMISAAEFDIEELIDQYKDSDDSN